MIRCNKARQDVARCDNILGILGTKFKVVTDINFLSKMENKVG